MSFTVVTKLQEEAVEPLDQHVSEALRESHEFAENKQQTVLREALRRAYQSGVRDGYVQAAVAPACPEAFPMSKDHLFGYPVTLTLQMAPGEFLVVPNILKHGQPGGTVHLDLAAVLDAIDAHLIRGRPG